MIISASRRTDIPAYYTDWFFNRLKAGQVYTKNPMNHHQISAINLSPDNIDAIVFWSKNPAPILPRLNELSDYTYYFQFTLTPYGTDIEAHLPDKYSVIVPTFKKLARIIGSERVIWRYDPIIFTNRYTVREHIRAFSYLAVELQGYTEKCVISFIDIYKSIKNNINALNLYQPDKDQLDGFLEQFAAIARQNSITLVSCAEAADLSSFGIDRGACIDSVLLERLLGAKLNTARDKNQRQHCRCIKSVDIGSYNTCLGGCKYCYAVHSKTLLKKNLMIYNSSAPLLCGKINDNDIIKKRPAVPCKNMQIDLFDCK